MAPPPEYDKEPKAPDKSATTVTSEEIKVHNLVNDLPTFSDHKTANSASNNEIENNKHVESLDDGQLRALLDEAIQYKCPKDREGKSSLFKELLEEVEHQDEVSEAASRGFIARGGPHANSLQDLMAALKVESTSRPVRHQPPPHSQTSVSARAIHGGSLPSGVDTSFLLAEEPTRGGYLATVRCVNPPPLAERRVSASDANTPAEMELLNKSKPMFPMYTARASLEIGSGSVCSGRAVTTTTPSNQVRKTTLPHPASHQKRFHHNRTLNHHQVKSRPNNWSTTRGPPERIYTPKSLYQPDNPTTKQDMLLNALRPKCADGAEDSDLHESSVKPCGRGNKNIYRADEDRQKTSDIFAYAVKNWYKDLRYEFADGGKEEAKGSVNDDNDLGGIKPRGSDHANTINDTNFHRKPLRNSRLSANTTVMHNATRSNHPDGDTNTEYRNVGEANTKLSGGGKNAIASLIQSNVAASGKEDGNYSKNNNKQIVNPKSSGPSAIRNIGKTAQNRAEAMGGKKEEKKDIKCIKQSIEDVGITRLRGFDELNADKVPKIHRTGYSKQTDKSLGIYTNTVNNWYKGLTTYTTPLNVNYTNNLCQIKTTDESNEIKNADINPNIDIKNIAECTDIYNPFAPKFETNLFHEENIIHTQSASSYVTNKSRQDDTCDIREYRKRVGKIVRASMSSVNPKNVRSMTIGKPESIDIDQDITKPSKNKNYVKEPKVEIKLNSILKISQESKSSKLSPIMESQPKKPQSGKKQLRFDVEIETKVSHEENSNTQNYDSDRREMQEVKVKNISESLSEKEFDIDHAPKSQSTQNYESDKREMQEVKVKNISESLSEKELDIDLAPKIQSTQNYESDRREMKEVTAKNKSESLSEKELDIDHAPKSQSTQNYESDRREMKEVKAKNISESLSEKELDIDHAPTPKSQSTQNYDSDKQEMQEVKVKNISESHGGKELDINHAPKSMSGGNPFELKDMSQLQNLDSGEIVMTFISKSPHKGQDVDSFSAFVVNQQNLFKSLESANYTMGTDTNNNDDTANTAENAESTKTIYEKNEMDRVEDKSNCDKETRSTNTDSSTPQLIEYFELKTETNTTVTEICRIQEPKPSEHYVLAELSNNAYIFLTFPKRLAPPQGQSVELQEIENHGTSNVSNALVEKKSSENRVGKKREINKNSLRVLLLESLLRRDGANHGLAPAAAADTQVDSTIPFSCITTPEVVASCNTTSSTVQSAVAVDPKPLQLGSCYRAVASLTGALPSPPSPPAPRTPSAARREQPRSVMSSTLNGLPLSRPSYGATASASADEYKKSLDENGNAVQGISSPISGSSQHKKPRRKKSSKNETVIKSHQIDGYQGNKDLNEVLRFIESNADAGRQGKLRGKHKDDDDKGKKRSAERRKDKEKVKRASSLEELSRTKLEDLTDAPEPPPAKPERRSWGDDARDAFYFRAPEPEPAPDADFQTVTKRRKPRRRDAERDERPERDARRARPPEPRARRESAPPSDRSNDSNDDMDSVHSLPAPARAPPAAHASYADIARTRHNIPDLIESCNFYAEGEGAGDARRSDAAPAPSDADGYPALEPRAAAARRQPAKPPPPSAAPRRDRKERAPAAPPDCPAPDVVADRRPPVILLDSEARPRDMDGVTFGFDINEQLLGGAARRPRCDLVRDAPDADGEAAVAAVSAVSLAVSAVSAVAVSAGCAALRYVPPAPPPDTHHLHQIIDYVGAAWEDVIRCGAGKVRYFSE